MLRIQIRDKSGINNEITKLCGYTEGEVNLKKLHESCKEMQSEVNSVLSDYVEQERTQGNSNTAMNEEDDNEDDSEDDEENDTNTSNGPAEKRLKT